MFTLCFKKNHIKHVKKTWLKQMEVIIKICDPPPYFHQKKEKSLLWYIIFFMENWSLVVSDLYRAHAERVGGRFTYNQLK